MARRHRDADFPERFPTIWRFVRGVGLDPSHDFLPVAPAAHYLSGGIVADLDGASNLPGPVVVRRGGVQRGPRPANRLASNSLLDGLVFGSRIIEAIAAGKDGADATGVIRGVPAWVDGPVVGPEYGGVTRREEFQRVLTQDAGVLRWRRLARACRRTTLRRCGPGPSRTPTCSRSARPRGCRASPRRESRGTASRLDYPERSIEYDGRFIFGHGADPVLVPLPTPETVA